jgi:hypothetical protein
MEGQLTSLAPNVPLAALASLLGAAIRAPIGGYSLVASSEVSVTP